MVPPPRVTIRIALDWTPNTIHSGLYLAQALGYYAARNIDVELLPPDEEYSKTPARRLQDGEVDLAICPSESCVAYQQSGRMKLQAIYAILQRDASAIVSTRLGKVAELGDGKVYGSYNARYEDRVVEQMVNYDGGDARGIRFAQQEAKLSMFDSLKNGRVDATWVFMPWEGMEAEINNVDLQVFRPGDYGIPYGYSPVIARNADSNALSQAVLWSFVAATMEGYSRAIHYVGEAVEEISRHCIPARSNEFLRRSQEQINEFYGDGGTLGRMSAQRWIAWLRWLESQGLVKENELAVEALFTNP